MKKTLIILITIAALSISAISALHTVKKSSLKKEMEKNIEMWKEGYNSGDAKNLIPLYAEHAIYASSHVQGLEAAGREKVITYFQGGISGGGHIDQIEILSMEESENLITLFCRYQATNSGVTVSGRNLLVLRKIQGRWQIVFHMTVV